jgi:hypothetical protein
MAFVARLADHALEEMGERSVSLCYSVEHSTVSIEDLPVFLLIDLLSLYPLPGALSYDPSGLRFFHAISLKYKGLPQIRPPSKTPTTTIINALVSSFEQRASFDKEQAMLSAILNNYFIQENGFYTAFSSQLPRNLPPYFHIRRMNQISGKIEYWAMLFMPSKTATAEWTDELYQMLQTEVPEVPAHGGCWMII